MSWKPRLQTAGLPALNLLKNHSYDMILMDITLGDMEGFDVIKKLQRPGHPDSRYDYQRQERGIMIPCTVCHWGPTTILPSPSGPLFWSAKVKALIRRNKNMVLDHSDVLDCGPFTYNTSTMRFYKGEEEISLSSKENSLMLLFMKHPGQRYLPKT